MFDRGDRITGDTLSYQAWLVLGDAPFEVLQMSRLGLKRKPTVYVID